MNHTYICEECTIVFQVYATIKRAYCPKCAEYITVTPYQPERTADHYRKVRWTPEEIKLLNQCVKGNLKAYQVAILLGRSTNAVMKKVARMKAEKHK